MPTFNDPKRAMEAVASVRNQSTTDWNMLVIDDGSQTGLQSDLKQSIAELGEPRIALVQSRKNRGAARARNIGIRLATGRYIAFLDGDDLWTDDKLETQLAFMKRVEAAICCTAYRNLDQDNGASSLRIPPGRVEYSGLLKENSVGCSTVILDRAKLGRSYFPEIAMRQDFAHWLKIARSGHVVHGLPEALTIRRTYQGSLSSNKWRAVRYTWKMYREIERLGFLPAAWNFSHYFFGGLAKRWQKSAHR